MGTLQMIVFVMGHLRSDSTIHRKRRAIHSSWSPALEYFEIKNLVIGCETLQYKSISHQADIFFSAFKTQLAWSSGTPDPTIHSIIHNVNR